MGLREALSAIRERWISVLAITILSVLLATTFTLSMSKSYTATAQNFVALTGTSEESANPLVGAQFAAQRVKSYTEIVSSPDVLIPVISQLGLPYTVAQLGSKVSATNPPQTVLLMVSAIDGNPALAAEIANAVSVQLGRVVEALETPNSQSIAPVKVTLTEPASPPESASSPQTRLNILLGLLLGLALGCGWAVLRDAFDSTVKSVDELGDSPTLGTVLFDTQAKTRVLSALDTKAVQSEGYRTVRTNLQYINVDDPVRAFVVTSAAPGDGKTTVACNLAIAIAQSNKSVCLVESDLRRPRVTDYMQINSGVGLTEVLAGQLSLDEALQTWGGGLLKVLPPGALPPNPSELLGSQQMAQVISRLKTMFDVVILDTPPLLAVSDAAVLASQADGAVIVVRYGKSSKDAVRDAVSSLDQINAKILGNILNAVPMKRGGSYAYNYGYGYGDGRATSEQKIPADRPGG